MSDRLCALKVVSTQNAFQTVPFIKPKTLFKRRRFAATLRLRSNLSCRRTAVLLGVLGPVSVAAQDSVVLRGRVLVDSIEVPVDGATVLLPLQGLMATTDSLGRFRLAGVARRTQDVVVRRIGFASFTGRLLLLSGDSLDVDFVLTPAVQVLPSVSVATTLISRKLAEFNDRRRFGIGHFLDSTDIAKRPGTRFSDKLRHLPGLMVACRSGACSLLSTRGQSSLLQRCPVRIGIDGMFVLPFSNIDELQPSAIAAVEWYAGPAQMPARFNTSRSACGFLMIWTK